MDTMTVEEYQAKIVHELIPLAVILSAICFIGIVGNLFTIVFYGYVAKRTSTVHLISILACVDVSVCILIIPQTAEMFANVEFTSAACKMLNFFSHWTVETSVLTLGFIAVDRYRHVCCPFQRQFNFFVAKRIVAVIIVFSFLLSLRKLANADTLEFPIDNRVANDSVAIVKFCGNSDDTKYKVSMIVFYSIDTVFAIVTLIILFYTYGKIVWTVKKGGFVLSANGKQADRESTRNVEASNRDVGGYTNAQATGEEVNTDNYENKPDRDNVRTLSKTKQLNNSKIKRAEIYITLMMLVVSVVFCVCFVPFLIVNVGLRSSKSASEVGLGAGIQLINKLPFVNSFASPIVFCFFNPQFRRFIKDTVFRRKSLSGHSSGLSPQNTAQ